MSRIGAAMDRIYPHLFGLPGWNPSHGADGSSHGPDIFLKIFSNSCG